MGHRHVTTSPQPILSLVFYGLAGLALALGIAIGAACLYAPSAFQPILGMLQVPLLDLFVKPLMRSLTVLGIVIVIGAAVGCALLVAFGRLLARNASLERRVDRIEAALVQVNLLPDCPVLDEAIEQALDGARDYAAH